jgi:hypothetical protein
MEKDKPSGNQTNINQTDTTHSIAAGHIEKVVIAPQQNRGFSAIHVSPVATYTLLQRNLIINHRAGHAISIEGTDTTADDNTVIDMTTKPPEKRTVLHMATKPPKPGPGI